jgi:hypothetical protein
MLVNNRQWVFPEVHPQYTIGLSAITRGKSEGDTIGLRGPFASQAAFDAGHHSTPARFAPTNVLAWNDSASLPLLPTEQSLEVFAQLRKAPRLDLNDGNSWRARPYAEAHSKNCKPYLLADCDDHAGAWPVFKGESFDLDTPDTGDYYRFADPEVMIEWLQDARIRQVRGSAYAEFPREWARSRSTSPWLHCRVAYRDVARATDTRTVITSVVPPRVFLADTAPYFLFPRGEVADQIYLYGVLRSIPLDWYARRFVETHVKFYLINSFPIPRPPRNDKRWQRVVALAGRLASPDKRFAAWAKAVGVDYGPLQDGEKEDMVAELDAVVAHLYGLTETQLVHIFETFHEGWDYAPRLAAVLAHFHSWAKRY